MLKGDVRNVLHVVLLLCWVVSVVSCFRVVLEYKVFIFEYLNFYQALSATIQYAIVS